jgi:predicted dinucleotide-binding enzyme
VILCGDDREAKDAVAALSERIVEGRAVDAGRLEVARWLEPVTAVIININRRYRTNAGIRVTGID